MVRWPFQLLPWPFCDEENYLRHHCIVVEMIEPLDQRCIDDHRVDATARTLVVVWSNIFSTVPSLASLTTIVPLDGCVNRLFHSARFSIIPDFVMEKWKIVTDEGRETQRTSVRRRYDIRSLLPFICPGCAFFDGTSKDMISDSEITKRVHLPN